MKPVLITQCLQNDFVQLLGKFDPLPNALHIGYKEALRLVGERPDEGPVNTLMKWAYKEGRDKLKIVHIRDWHDNNDAAQQEHLRQFGAHCIKNTEGAEFIFRNSVNENSDVTIVNASGLNDFHQTELEKTLEAYSGQQARVGVVGVWTEAKITFLLYELRTRYPKMDIAVCSALTASSSTHMHFIALDQLKSILGVKVFESIGDFTNFLSGSMPEVTAEVNARVSSSKFVFDHDTLMASDKNLLAYLFRDSKEAAFKVLDGGFSGNVVLKASASDLHGHRQVPSVIKIGKRSLMAKERASFERIQEILGNNAPAIVDFAEDNERGAIKYRYAAMLDEKVISFQKFYESGAAQEKVFSVLDVVFDKQLGRLYRAAKQEKIDLLKYYDFSSKYAASVRAKVEQLTGRPATGDRILLHGKEIYNVCNFYEKELDARMEYPMQGHYMSYVHGDLNGANIIIDAQQNVWMIDFFHTHYGHVLRDLIKLENDLLFIFTKINSEREFHEAAGLIDVIVSLEDLGDLPGSDTTHFENAELQRTFLTVRKLRNFYPALIHSDKIAYQYHVAMLRYAMHTLSFDECNEWQKKLALYMGSYVCEKALRFLKASSKLRIDFISDEKNRIAANGKIGLTILPGRLDRKRKLSEDLSVIRENGIKNVVCLLTENEFSDYGVPALKSEYRKNGFDVYYYKILDQAAGTASEMMSAIDWVKAKTDAGENVLVHCVGGLGRSGMLAACFHKKYSGLPAQEAIDLVRKCRGQRAIETEVQEDFVLRFQG
jgi:protein-tyrosine phosphatase/nicotinamidase-related amidase